VRGGRGVLRKRKIRNITAGHRRSLLWSTTCAPSSRSWGVASASTGRARTPSNGGGMVGQGHYVRVTPTISWGWNLEGAPVGDTWSKTGHTEIPAHPCRAA
jgi:pyridoxamine 5'-phosphate oxidase family protein